MESVEGIPDNLGIRVADVGKLRGGDPEDNLGTGKFLPLEKSLDRLGIGTPLWKGGGAINDAQEVLPNKDSLHKEGPFVVICLGEGLERGSFVGHQKRGSGQRWETGSDGVRENGNEVNKNGRREREWQRG